MKRSNTYLHKIQYLKIHGISGYQLFARFQVKIDFDKQLIMLSEPNKTDSVQDFHAIPLTIKDTKPFIELNAMTTSDVWHQLQLLLDLGANHKILIHERPETSLFISSALKRRRIAEGLNGEIYGYYSSLEKIRIGPISFGKSEILIPTQNTYHQESMVMKKHGSIGSKSF